MARKTRVIRRYARRAGRKLGKVPIFGYLDAAALAAPIVAGSNGKIQYAGSPLGYLKEGNWQMAGQSALANVTNPRSYIPFVVVMLIHKGLKWGLGTVPLGRGKKLL